MLSRITLKVRTAAVDEISQILVQKIDEDPEEVIRESDSLLEFLIQILSDQNFKIVLTTMNTISKRLLSYIDLQTRLLQSPLQKIQREV